MVRLTERFIFLPTSLEVLGLAWTVERVRTRSVDRTLSSAAAFAIWAFFSSLRKREKNSVNTISYTTLNGLFTEWAILNHIMTILLCCTATQHSLLGSKIGRAHV